MYRSADNIVVLTGAGISAESGIKTFRATDGLWEEHRIEDVASPEGFARDPQLVHNFYNIRRHAIASAQPNPAHIALAQFEQTFSGTFTLITQNIDDLHERAGSQNIFHMHGEAFKIRCQACTAVLTHKVDVDVQSACPRCHQRGSLRPHIVWFGEMPFYMEEIYRQLANCDLFVAIGTSGNVYPAAGFFQLARQAGAHTVELNLEPSENGSLFAECHYGMASEVVPAYFREFKTRRDK